MMVEIAVSAKGMIGIGTVDLHAIVLVKNVLHMLPINPGWEISIVTVPSIPLVASMTMEIAARRKYLHGIGTVPAPQMFANVWTPINNSKRLEKSNGKSWFFSLLSLKIE